MIRILITDDHHLFREGLSRVLNDIPEMTVVASLDRGEDAVARVADLKPDVILMDVNMPGIGGVEATRQVREKYPQVQVLMLTVSEQENDLFSAIRAGAHGYLLKNSTSAELVDAIQRIHGGDAVISPLMARKLLGEFTSLSQRAVMVQDRTAVGGDDLSERERDVLQQVAGGLSNKEIGAALNLSPHTVKAHMRTILDKLHLRSRSEAAAWAAMHGLTSDSRD